MNWTPFEIDPLRNTVILKFESWEYQKAKEQGSLHYLLGTML